MTAHGRWRGHRIEYDEEARAWRYGDGRRVEDEPDRPCGHCGRENTPDGHDACLGTISGAQNACCGHGSDRESYVQYPDGRRISGPRAIEIFERGRQR